MLWCSFNFGGYFKFLFYESPRRIDTFAAFLRGPLTQKKGKLENRTQLSILLGDWQHAYIVEEHSRRTAVLVVNYSRRSYESPRSIDTFAAFLRGPLTQKKGKLENRTQLSILLGDFMNHRGGLDWNASILKLTV